jgi:hypothetical protein
MYFNQNPSENRKALDLSWGGDLLNNMKINLI